MDDNAAQLCRERIHSLGLRMVRMKERQGPFAARIYEVFAKKSGSGKTERLMYKLAPKDRSGEFDLIGKLGDELSAWLPDIVHRFEDEPRALLMKYAGEPLLESHPISPAHPEQRLRLLSRIAGILSNLHLGTEGKIGAWVREGKLGAYAYSREWANRALSLAGSCRSLGQPVMEDAQYEELREKVNHFYRGYSEKAMRGPYVLTHGDPHWGNILQHGGIVTLIDWEWAQAASPMRDAAIMLQEEPDDQVMLQIADLHAEMLVRGGYGGDKEGLRADFDRMMADNTVMMLGWDLELYARGIRTWEETRAAAAKKRERFLYFWDRVSRREVR